MLLRLVRFHLIWGNKCIFLFQKLTYFSYIGNKILLQRILKMQKHKGEKLNYQKPFII